MKDLEPADIIELLTLDHTFHVRIERLAGDASSRRYSRVLIQDRDPLIIMQMEDPTTDEAKRFIRVQEFLQESALPVPQIHGFDLKAGLIALEDLGRTHLADMVNSSRPEALADLYAQAVSVLIKLRRQSQDQLARCASFNPAFDTRKFMDELHFFLRYFVGELFGLSTSGTAASSLQELFESICSEMDWQHMVLCHRDYHSRNLMWFQGCLYLIDFQDARIGPEQYDLASLLRDSYVTLPEYIVQELINAYYQESLRNRDSSFDAFRYFFDVASLQRNIKALGTFAYQTCVRRSRRYLESIPRTCIYIQSNVQKHARFAQFASVVNEFIVGPGLSLESGADDLAVPDSGVTLSSV